MAEKIQLNDERITIAHPSERTIRERNKFASSLDNFATFNWANTDMFANFGAFIINEKKGSLKLYNGPTFKNNYSKPQFQNGYTNLTGVTFETQTISFTIGVYWISIEDYRILLNLLHPYQVDMLWFDFELTYGYFCKLQSIKDSTRYIIGNETTPETISSNSVLQNSRIPSGNTSGARYYTELQLTFDVIGAQCAKEIIPNQIDGTSPLIEINSGEENETIVTISFEKTPYTCYSWFVSDLDYPFELTLPLVYLDDAAATGNITLSAQLQYQVDPNQSPIINTFQLFSINLKNIDKTNAISLKYDSEHGLLYWILSNQAKLLSLLSTQSNGQRITSAVEVQSFYWPGKLTLPEIEHCKVTLTLTATQHIILFSDITDLDNIEESQSLELTYQAQRRTNVI